MLVKFGFSFFKFTVFRNGLSFIYLTLYFSDFFDKLSKIFLLICIIAKRLHNLVITIQMRCLINKVVKNRIQIPLEFRQNGKTTEYLEIDKFLKVVCNNFK